MNKRKLKKKVIDFFADIRIYWFGFVLFGNSSYHVKGDDMRKCIDKIKKGDVLLRRYSHYLGSVLIPGYFSHAAIYAGNNKVIHMLGDGINKEDILTFLRCDDVCILRYHSDEITQDALIKAESHLYNGIEYDYDFDTDSPKRFYCTEFVDNCFGYSVKYEFDLKRIMPDDFLKSKRFIKIWRKGE